MVVITGYGTEENEARASVLGVSGFVRKPLTPEIIESVTLKAITEKDVILHAAERPVGAEVSEETASKPIERSKTGLFFKNIGLFFAAPFVALGYVIALPFVGFYMFAKLAFEAYKKSHPSV